MATIAYLTNAAPNSGVGSRATNVKRELADMSNHILLEYNIDGVAGVVRKNDQQIFAIKRWAGPLGSKTVNWIRLAKQIETDIKASQVDLVHATNQTLSFIEVDGVPKVVTVHDIIEVLAPQSRFGGLLARYLYKGIKLASHIITVSDFTAQSIRDFYKISPENITVIPNGVGKEFTVIDNFEQTIAYQMWQQNLKISPTTKVILYVGSEHPRKNVKTALAAFAKVHETYPDSVFIKVGAPGLAAGRKLLLKQISSLGIKDAVRLLDNVDDEQLCELYNLADIFVFPSTFEGFGLPPLQAMACGTPVVSSNATSLEEVVGDAGVMLDPFNANAFAENILRLLSDKKHYQDLQKRGLEHAKQFSWKMAAQTELAVYNKVLAAHS